jgi:hypothetical protein
VVRIGVRVRVRFRVRVGVGVRVRVRVRVGVRVGGARLRSCAGLRVVQVGVGVQCAAGQARARALCRACALWWARGGGQPCGAKGRAARGGLTAGMCIAGCVCPGRGLRCFWGRVGVVLGVQV